ncbi:MAG: hypothetical protein K0Q61_134 [Rhodococcus erythropolis]|nr:hypothetical protein [Rhodococcus erythropolis]
MGRDISQKQPPAQVDGNAQPESAARPAHVMQQYPGAPPGVEPVDMSTARVVSTAAEDSPIADQVVVAEIAVDFVQWAKFQAL